MDYRDTHKYLCWLDQIRYLGRKSIFSLLASAGERSLFSDRALSEDCPTDRSAQEMDLCVGEGTPAKAAAGMKAEDDLYSLMAQGARALYSVPEPQLRFLCSEAFPTTGRAEKAVCLLLKARKKEPGRIEENLEKAGISFFAFPEEGFPDRLRTIPDPPFGLYFLGKEPPDSMEPSAAIIGARLASEYGREQARRFSRRLASRGITIISGMARGIDGIAQKAALDAGGKSYAVLGSGVDICYPEENRELYDRLLQEGGILSEYPPGTYPDARLFPQRNRIISGLSDLVLVVQARARSGTLITVDMALEQGREVYALPGRVSDSLSDGCNRLIRQGAGAATCPEDVLEYFFGAGDENCVETGDNANEKRENEEEGIEERNVSEKEGECEKRKEEKPLTLEQRILRSLSREDEKHVERLLEEIQGDGQDPEADSCRPSLSRVLTCLVRMKIDGRVEETAAGYYRRCGR